MAENLMVENCRALPYRYFGMCQSTFISGKIMPSGTRLIVQDAQGISCTTLLLHAHYADKPITRRSSILNERLGGLFSSYCAASILCF